MHTSISEQAGSGISRLEGLAHLDQTDALSIICPPLLPSFSLLPGCEPVWDILPSAIDNVTPGL